jgi:hypothetical protein
MILAGGMIKDAHFPLSVVFQFSAAGLLVVGVLLFCLQPKTTPIAGPIPLTDLKT